MASNPDFVQYIIDQCSGAGEIAVKKMMGDYCAYCDGVLFGLICDNNFYVKVTEPGGSVSRFFIKDYKRPICGSRSSSSCGSEQPSISASQFGASGRMQQSVPNKRIINV